MDESLIYFRFYSTLTMLTVHSLSEKIRNTLKEKGYTGPHDIFQHKEQKKSDRQTLNRHWRNESQAGFQQFSVGISILEDKSGASFGLCEIFIQFVMKTHLSPAMLPIQFYGSIIAYECLHVDLTYMCPIIVLAHGPMKH